jgi:hypothetical protein
LGIAEQIFFERSGVDAPAFIEIGIGRGQA